jgi:hypothetical protein
MHMQQGPVTGVAGPMTRASRSIEEAAQSVSGEEALGYGSFAASRAEGQIQRGRPQAG